MINFNVIYRIYKDNDDLVIVYVNSDSVRISFESPEEREKYIEILKKDGKEHRTNVEVYENYDKAFRRY